MISTAAVAAHLEIVDVRTAIATAFISTCGQVPITLDANRSRNCSGSENRFDKVGTVVCVGLHCSSNAARLGMEILGVGNDNEERNPRKRGGRRGKGERRIEKRTGNGWEGGEEHV